MNKIIKTSVAEEREYVRMKSIFPVEFSVDTEDDKPARWYQGYTQDVSEGGLCLETSFMDDEMSEYLQQREALLNIQVRIPLAQPGLEAKVKVAWIRKKDKIHHIGLKFFHVEKNAVERMMHQVWWMRFSTQIVLAVTIVFLFGFIATGIYSQHLRQANETLVEKLVVAQLETVEVKMSLRQIENQKGMVSQLLQKPLKAKERQELVAQYHALERQAMQANDKFAVMKKVKNDLQQSVLGNMNVWLKNHQNSSTGLILSFGGDIKSIKNQAFTYDQALALNVFLKSGDIAQAGKILDFYNKKIDNKFEGFSVGYHFNVGKEVDKNVYSGPNVWMGIAAIQYQVQTGDDQYLPLAKTIADWLLTIQSKNPDGGLQGGSKFSWLIVEDNLDAFAFFGMINAITREAKYLLAQKKVLSWLQKKGFPKDFKRIDGRISSTISTNTFVWAIAALGPHNLMKLGMDSEEIIKFAEEKSQVDVQFLRPTGDRVLIKGFDFSVPEHASRGGAVSPEWTSQMIIAYKLVSRYFLKMGAKEKALDYHNKAEFYLGELNKLIILSPSARGQGDACLPYSTLDDVDTGHGWRVTKGSRSCSVAGTSYMMLAIQDFNPLVLVEEDK